MALNFPDSPILNQIYTDSTSGFSYQWNGTVWQSYSASTTSNITELDDISGSFNGSTTIFPLTVGGQSVSPASTNQLIISVGGVMQNPTDDFYISGGSNIVFTTAPTSGLTFFGTLFGTAVPIGVSTIGDVYNRQTYSVTGVQTNFTFTSGYTVGYLDVFRNGSRLIAGDDFTATTGSTFDLDPPAQNGDNVEAIGYKVSTIAITEGNLTDLLVSNNATVLGIVTASSFFGDGSALTGIAVTYAPTAGIATVAQGLTGTPNINVGIVTATNVVATGITVGVSTVNTTLDVRGNYKSGITSMAALDVDCSLGNYFTKTIAGLSTFTFSNVPSESAFSFTLELTHTSGTITWPTEVKWPSDTAPTLTTGRTHLFIFVTDDGGTRWRGSSLVDYVN